MKRWRCGACGLLALLGMATAWAIAPPSPKSPLVVELRIDGAISPASADYVVHGIAEANERHAAAIVLELDTPGGLSSSMRDIIKAILASEAPVIGYVAPSGARAASAGTYILYACHLAAMAPATNIGAASPVSLTGSGGMPAPSSSSGKPAAGESTEMRKVTNDAVAYIRALAERRGRNADWAEKAVREAVSVSDTRALKLHVIDLVAPNLAQLLNDVEGRTVQTVGGARVLHSRDATVESIPPGWRSQFLGVIANPSVAYILLLIGLGGLVMEGMHPGGVLPGVVGAICLLLALYAFQLLPVNFAGLGLILLGVILIVAEAFVPAYGVLGTGGVVSFVIGSVIFMDTGVPGYGIALPVVIGIAIAAAGILAGIVWMAVRSRDRPVVSGREEMVGAIGEVVADFEGLGSVHVHGERWQARSDVPLKRGQAITVTSIHGLVLDVKPVAVPKEVAS